MDANVSDALASLPFEQGHLVPVSSVLLADPDPGDDFKGDLLALLWQCFCQLALHLVLALRQLQSQLGELRWQANYWRAQHQRAVQREAALAAQVQQLTQSRNRRRDQPRRREKAQPRQAACAGPATRPSGPWPTQSRPFAHPPRRL